MDCETIFGLFKQVQAIRELYIFGGDVIDVSALTIPLSSYRSDLSSLHNMAWQMLVVASAKINCSLPC